MRTEDLIIKQLLALVLTDIMFAINGKHPNGQYLYKCTIPMIQHLSTSDKDKFQYISCWNVASDEMQSTHCDSPHLTLPRTHYPELTWLSPNSNMCFCMPSSCFFNCEF